MSALTATLRARIAAEGLMADEATISRSGAPTFDPNTGLMTSTSTTIHSGPCRIRQPNSVETNVMFGEEDVTKMRLIACFPHDVTGVLLDDVITVTESDDADLLERELKVVALPSSTFVAYKAYGCEVVA